VQLQTITGMPRPSPMICINGTAAPPKTAIIIAVLLGSIAFACLLIHIFNKQGINEMLFGDTSKFNLDSRHQLSNNKQANQSVLALTCVNLSIGMIGVTILVIRLFVILIAIFLGYNRATVY